MNKKKPLPKNNSFSSMEKGYLVLLVVIASLGFIWLFTPFLNSIFFAIIATITTYPIYKRGRQKFHNLADGTYTILFCLLLVIIITIPILIFMSELIKQLAEISQFVRNFDFSQANSKLVQQKTAEFLSTFQLNDKAIKFLQQQITNSIPQIASQSSNLILNFTTSFFAKTANLLVFFSLTIFTMFFLYKDGPKIIKRIVILSPLRDSLDDILVTELNNLSTVLTVSVVTIAMMQGLVFGIFASFFDLPWLLLGFGLAILSFIPIIGAAMIWIPVSLYLVILGNYYAAATIIFVGVFLNGVVIDNMVRPLLIKKLNKMVGADAKTSPINYTLIIVLSTLAGLISFGGIMGLFFGPVIAAMTLTIYNVYYIYHENNMGDS